MATAIETMTSTDQSTGVHQENGTLVHKYNDGVEVQQHTNPIARQSLSMVPAPQQLQHQPRPQSLASAAYSPSGEEDARPGEKKTQRFLPWYTRWGYSMSLGAAQGFLKPASFIRDTQDAIRSPLHNPHLVKVYECRKSLPVRVFFPKPYDKTKPRKLPVLFTIHGGHFLMGTPQDNDAWNAKFATKFAYTVIALNYGKAPKNAFPRPIHDVEALLLAALADPELASFIDRSRVSVLGWSSGGNLALTVTQLPAVRRIVHSVVALYPTCDFTVSHHTKSRLRRYKPGLGGFRARETDYMISMAPMIDWSYVPQGTELRNPLLSPYFADHESLPNRVFIVGCEMDMYAHEAWRTITKLAGREVPGFETPVGREQPFAMGTVHKGLDGNDTDDSRFHFEQRYQDGSSYKWLLVPDTIHNFDQRIGGVLRDVEFRQDAEDKSQIVQQEIGGWLGEGFPALTAGTLPAANGTSQLPPTIGDSSVEGAPGTTNFQRQIE